MPNDFPPLLLASTSPTRLRLLVDAGLAVHAVGSGVDEDAVPSLGGDGSLEGEELAARRATALARVKAAAVGRRHPEALVLGSDQVALDPLNGEVFGKPKNAADHFDRLRSLRGREHVLVTAWVLVGRTFAGGGVDTSKVTLRRDVDDDELAAYVACGEGAGCAAGYAVEGRGAFLVEHIDGDVFAVLGLPLHPVLASLRAVGWRFRG